MDLLTLTKTLRSLIQEAKPEFYGLDLKPVALPPPQIAKPIAIEPPVIKPTPKPVAVVVAPPKPVGLKPLKVEKEILPPSDIAAKFHRLFPGVFLHNEIPSDKKAREVKNGWKIKSRLIDVPIFASREQEAFLPLLTNIAKAIDASFAPSRVIQIEAIEAKDVWETLLDPNYIRLILCPDVILWSSKGLVNHYKQQPLKSIQKLGEIDLILLPDLSLYLKDPLLKQALYNMLSQYFA